MAVNCHGICGFYKTTKIKTSMKYETGQKRCTFCSIFIETTYGIPDLITHGLIFTMLTFFIIGIFRSD
ncbi:MAG: hypothetical protein IIB02_04090 [Thaumarchaeota archaeon]|nr:hypothetical protein [Nitrososphaerota archaeon]